MAFEAPTGRWDAWNTSRPSKVGDPSQFHPLARARVSPFLDCTPAGAGRKSWVSSVHSVEAAERTLVQHEKAPSSFLLLVVRPGDPSSVLPPSSDASSPY